MLQTDDLIDLTPDALVALRRRYAGPPMDALTVVVNRYCDGVEPAPEEYRSAMEQAETVGKLEEVLRSLEKIALERSKWHRDGSSRRVNHWRQA